VRLLLMMSGADPNYQKDKDDTTPLYAVTESSFYDAAQMLLTYGADTNLACGINQ
jgi:ankyrin repeat protein